MNSFDFRDAIICVLVSKTTRETILIITNVCSGSNTNTFTQILNESACLVTFFFSNNIIVIIIFVISRVRDDVGLHQTERVHRHGMADQTHARRFLVSGVRLRVFGRRRSLPAAQRLGKYRKPDKRPYKRCRYTNNLPLLQK